MTIEQVRTLTGREFEFYATSIEDGSIIFCLPIPGSRFLYWTDTDGNLILPGDPFEAVQYLIKAWKAYLDNPNGGNQLRTDDVCEDGQPAKRQYRTRNKAGKTDRLPKNIPSITRYPYENSMSFRPCDGNHMVMLGGDISKDLEYRDGKLYYRGTEISRVDQDGQLYSQDMYDMPVATPEHGFPSSNTDLETLRYLYGTILLKYSGDMEAIVERIDKEPSQFLTHSISIYLPDLLRNIGLSPNTNRANIFLIINKINSYSQYWGITKTILQGWSRPLYDYYPALSAVGYSESDNMLRLTSPYLNYIVLQTIQASIKRDKKGNLMRSRSGHLLREPMHSYHVQASIMKERNYRAIEIVHIVCELIDKTGNNTPHISFRTIIEDKFPQFKADLDGMPDGSTRNKTLKRTFTAAWSYLQKHTDLRATYKNIQLPDPKNPANIPTMKALNDVIRFPHEGRIKGNPQQK